MKTSAAKETAQNGYVPIQTDGRASASLPWLLDMTTGNKTEVAIGRLFRCANLLVTELGDTPGKSPSISATFYLDVNTRRGKQCL